MLRNKVFKCRRLHMRLLIIICSTQLLHNKKATTKTNTNYPINYLLSALNGNIIVQLLSELNDF